VPKGPPTIFLLLPSSVIPYANIEDLLRPYFEPGQGLPRYLLAVVPVHPPLSSEQAKSWSECYWPCVYNPASQVLQDAPPLHLLRRLRTELDTDFAASCLNLATMCAEQALSAGHGRNIGAVVVDPVTKVVLAVAADARWCTGHGSQFTAHTATDMGGRPEYHALMRVIAMVANKELRRRLASGQHTRFAVTSHESFTGQPLTPLEMRYARDPTQADVLVDHNEQTDSLPPVQTQVRTDGYLCSGLDIYLTHEPCVCCAMAMVHSRFRSCVFVNRMNTTGALSSSLSQGGLGYGLFWRRELNWRVMTFQYNLGSAKGVLDQELSEEFHA